MYKPTRKTEGLDTFIKNFFGKCRKTTIENGECMCCDKANLEFKDDLSRREYEISGICQTCQSVFEEKE